MPTILEEFENKAKNLPLKDRAALIGSLISSLDELGETECEELWAQEADKRYQAYKARKITSRPAEAVFSDAREMLKEVRLLEREFADVFSPVFRTASYIKLTPMKSSLLQSCTRNAARIIG